MRSDARSAGGRAPLWRLLLAVIALLFGLATLVEGGRTLFGDDAARAAAGDYVPFVLWFNFIAGFAYLAAAAALAFARRWSAWLAAGIAATTLLVFAALGVHIAAGGAFEARTVVAMALRSGFWVCIAAVAPALLRRPPPPAHA